MSFGDCHFYQELYSSILSGSNDTINDIKKSNASDDEKLKNINQFTRGIKNALEFCLGEKQIHVEIQELVEEVEQNPRKPNKKICCTCKPTKKYRDACVMEFGPGAVICEPMIAAHNMCLIDEGFPPKHIYPHGLPTEKVL